MKKLRHILALVALLCTSAVALAGYTAFYFENDLLDPVDNQDRWYTDGWRFTYGIDDANSVFLAQNMYTPTDISLPLTEPLDRDRRYVGWTYLGYGHWFEPCGPGRFYTEASLGLTGPGSLTEETQKGIHWLFNNREPMGWDSQSPDRLAVQTYTKYQKTLMNTGKRTGGDIWVGAALGNEAVYGEAALIGKCGRGIDSPIGVDNISVKSVENSLYMYAGVIARHQVYDYSIDVSRGLILKNTVIDNVVGITWETDYGFDINYQWTHRTTQYIPQPEAARFGAVSLRYRF